MSNFHRSGAVTKQEEPMKSLQKTTYSRPNISKLDNKITKEFAPVVANSTVVSNVTPINNETNESAFRKSMNAGSQHSKKEASMASRTGRNIVSHTPKSKHSSVVNSNRMIRTGAFQKIKA